jgi:hypothetical protein
MRVDAGRPGTYRRLANTGTRRDTICEEQALGESASFGGMNGLPAYASPGQLPTLLSRDGPGWRPRGKRVAGMNAGTDGEAGAHFAAKQ